MVKQIAIVGAGPAGLMAAEVLSQYGYAISVYEQKPSAARKFLMAGKTGLNISHAEALENFIQRYDQPDWLRAWIQQWDAGWIQNWMQGLGISAYIGSSGRIFPKEMKAAPLLRAWLRRLAQAQVKFYYRHQVMDLTEQQLTVCDLTTQRSQVMQFHAIILACGAVSWPKLGSDGAWQAWLNPEDLHAFQPSNVGVSYPWSSFMQPVFGQPLKRVAAWVDDHSASIGDIVISHYGLESGLIYKYGRALRQQQQQQHSMQLYLDLLPDQSVEQLVQKLQPSKKQSLANIWRKAGLDTAKVHLLRELVAKPLWQQPEQLAMQIKKLALNLSGFRPIEEAISCAGGIRRDRVSAALQLHTHPAVFVCGEMLDWDAPTGGYLLTACFATGRAAGEGVHQFLSSPDTVPE